MALVLGRDLSQVQLDSGALADDFRVRFQQTCGPVMAKGIEDTAYYRWFRLAGANEVGGHPDHLSISADEFHAWCQALVTSWPTSMTTLTTHDTKRSEDVRARLMALAEDGAGWATWLAAARELAAGHRTERVDGPTEYLVWQTLVGTWPITGARLEEYLLKAVREAKVHTAWVDGDPAYEDEVVAYGKALFRDPAVQRHLDDWTTVHEPSVRANVLSQKLIQLTMPGVPDVYQGCEIVMLSLVDPDNRRPVDWTDRGERLERVLADEPAFDLDDEKLRVTARTLGVRRDLARVFVGEGTTYTGLPTTSEHALAFARGDDDGRAGRHGGHPRRRAARGGRRLRRRDRGAAGRHLARRALRRRGGLRRHGGAPRRPAGPPTGGPAREAVVTAPEQAAARGHRGVGSARRAGRDRVDRRGSPEHRPNGRRCPSRGATR